MTGGLKFTIVDTRLRGHKFTIYDLRRQKEERIGQDYRMGRDDF